MSNEIEKLRKEKSKAESKSLWKEAAAICNCIGQELCKLGQYKDALSYHQEELELCTMQADRLGIAVANRRIGECYSELSDFKKALHHQKIFLDLAIKHGSTVEEQRAWATLGRTYYFQFLYELNEGLNKESKPKSLDKAEQSFVKALQLSDCLKNTISPKEYAQMRARLLLNLGLVYEHRGNLTKCAESIRHAIFLTKKFHLNEDLNRCQFSLASVYQRCEQYNFALRLLDEAISSAKLLHDKTLICDAISGKANVLILLKDFEGAKTYLKKAYKLHSPITDDHDKIEKHLKITICLCMCEQKLLRVKDSTARKSLLEKIADGLASLGCYRLAVEYYQSTLKCMETMNAALSDKAPIYFSLAQTFADEGKQKEALEYFRKEFECNKSKPVEQIKTLWKMASVNEEQGNFKEAEKVNHEALFIAEFLNSEKLTFLCLKRLKEQYEDNFDSIKAQEISERLKNFDEFDNVTSEEENEDTQQLFDDVTLSELSDCTDSDVEKEMCDGKQTRRRVKRPETKRNELGETPLHRACITGNLNMIKQLVESGHPVNARDNCGWLPLHEACNFGYCEIVEYLLAKGALINDRGGKHCEGITPLHDAAACGNLDVMKLLISKGASVAGLNNNGESPLDCFIKWWKRTEEDLDQETVNQCNIMETKLKKLMKQVGQNVGSQVSPKPSTSSHDISVTKNKSSEIIINKCSRQKEKRMRSPSISSDTGDDDETVYTNPHINWAGENNLDDPREVESEYQAVMSTLRRSGLNQPIPIQSKLSENQNVAALLDEEEVVHEWLIKDTREKPKTSKRKRTTVSGKKPKRNHLISNFITVNKGNKENSLLFQNDDSQSSGNITIDEDSNSSHSKTETSVRAETQINPDISSSMHSNQTNVCNTTISQSFCLRVHIVDKIILVPVTDDSYTIGWLADEAAKRFQNIVGSKPHLTLMKKDGALLSSSDLIKIVLQNNENVATSVTSWDQPSLTERYEQICGKSGLVVVQSLKKRMLSLEATSELNFYDTCIPAPQLTAIFSCLQHCKTLTYLNVSNNEIGDESLSSFISCLPSFTSLVSLNLSCCCLSLHSIEKLAKGLSDSQSRPRICSKLKHLDLSYNLFGPKSASAFSVILELPSLVVLNLSECSITSDFFQEKMLSDTLQSKTGLQEFNIANNILDAVGMAEMFSFLPTTNLRKLDLSHTVSTKIDFGRHLFKYMSCNLPFMSELCLEGCCLTDDDLFHIAKSIMCCPKLTFCNLSSNPCLSVVAITDLLKAAHSYNVPLYTLYATGSCYWNSKAILCFSEIFCLELLKKVQLDNVPELLQELLFNAWTDIWGSKAVCTNEMLCELSVQLNFPG